MIEVHIISRTLAEFYTKVCFHKFAFSVGVTKTVINRINKEKLLEPRNNYILAGQSVSLNRVEFDQISYRCTLNGTH
jgi:hypothetical protein